MANLRVIPANLADNAAVSASTVAGTYVAANMQNGTRSARWRSTGTSATITIAFAADVSIDSVALMGGNLSTSATWQVKLLNAAAATLFDSTAVNAAPAGWLSSQSILWLPTIYSTVRSITIAIVDTSNPSGYIEAARVVAGLKWSASSNMTYGAQLSIAPADIQGRAEDGTLRGEKRAVSRELSFGYDALTEADRTSLMTYAATLGQFQDFLISGYPGDSSATKEMQHMMMAKFSGNVSTTVAYFSTHSAQVKVVEA